MRKRQFFCHYSIFCHYSFSDDRREKHGLHLSCRIPFGKLPTSLRSWGPTSNFLRSVGTPYVRDLARRIIQFSCVQELRENFFKLFNLDPRINSGHPRLNYSGPFCAWHGLGYDIYFTDKCLAALRGTISWRLPCDRRCCTHC